MLIIQYSHANLVIDPPSFCDFIGFSQEVAVCLHEVAGKARYLAWKFLEEPAEVLGFQYVAFS